MVMSGQRRGAMAQLGARLNGIQEVEGSNPSSSTIILFVNKGGTAGNSRPLSWEESFYFY